MDKKLTFSCFLEPLFVGDKIQGTITLKFYLIQAIKCKLSRSPFKHKLPTTECMTWADSKYIPDVGAQYTRKLYG